MLTFARNVLPSDEMQSISGLNNWIAQWINRNLNLLDIELFIYNVRLRYLVHMRDIRNVMESFNSIKSFSALIADKTTHHHFYALSSAHKNATNSAEC